MPELLLRATPHYHHPSTSQNANNETGKQNLQHEPMQRCNAPHIPYVFILVSDGEAGEGEGKTTFSAPWHVSFICRSTGYYILTFLHIFLLSFIFSPHLYRGRGQTKIQVSIRANAACSPFVAWTLDPFGDMIVKSKKKKRKEKKNHLRLHSASTDMQECWE